MLKGTSLNWRWDVPHKNGHVHYHYYQWFHACLRRKSLYPAELWAQKCIKKSLDERSPTNSNGSLHKVPHRAYFPDQRLCLRPASSWGVSARYCTPLFFLVSNSSVLVERPGGSRWAIKASTNLQPKHQPFLLQKSLLSPPASFSSIAATHLLSQQVYNQSLFQKPVLERDILEACLGNPQYNYTSSVVNAQRGRRTETFLFHSPDT